MSELIRQQPTLKIDRSFIADQLGSWCASLEYNALPEDVVWNARRAIFDTIGVISAGGKHRLVGNILETLDSQAGPSVAIGGKHMSPQAAALVNGVAAHVYDFDDTSYTGIMHGSAVIVPALLAVADEIKCSRKKLITAFVAGSEITYTLADYLTHSHYFKGWWSTGTIGLIGATAAVCKLYEIDAEKTASAIGLAVAGACGTKAIFGTDGKALFVGEAARRAVDFAKFASVGVKGPHDAMESARGFVSLLNDGTARPDHLNTLGERWRLTNPGLLIKRYPVCSAAHAVIEQVASLVEEAKCNEQDVAHVICEIPELVDISLIYDRPKNIQQAQFSLSYSVACALRYGAVRLKDLNTDMIRSTKMQSLMARVDKKVDAKLSTNEMREKYPESARVKLVLNNGKIFSGFCGEAYGMPGRALNDDDLVSKFRDCLSFAGHNPEASARFASELMNEINQSTNRCLTKIVNDIWMLPNFQAMRNKNLS